MSYLNKSEIWNKVKSLGLDKVKGLRWQSKQKDMLQYIHLYQMAIEKDYQDTHDDVVKIDRQRDDGGHDVAELIDSIRD